MRRVVITGLGTITCLGNSAEETWSRLLAGTSGLAPVRSFDASSYKTKIAGEASSFDADRWTRDPESAGLDRASHLLFAAADEAVSQARLDRQELAADRAGIVLGTTLGGMLQGEAFHRTILSGAQPAPGALADYLAFMQGENIATRCGVPAMPETVSTACASGATAIGLAFRRIRNGEIDLALAGGYDTMCRFTFAGFDSLQLLDPETCRPFDLNRRGLVLGEGVGILVLEEAGRAAARGVKAVAEVRGFGTTSDAYHTTRAAPSGEGAAAAVRIALNDAGAAPEDIDYVNAHGTGTPVNDRAEVAALSAVFGPRLARIPVSSTKSMIGHLLGAAGAVEAIVSALAIRDGMIHPTANFTTADPACPIDAVPEGARRVPVRAVLTNSFGFGGNNACLVLMRC
ncbi:MAG: beta-ketoacyl-[acyl-carrier-protein] synthase family protein [Nitrospirota bacterium]